MTAFRLVFVALLASLVSARGGPESFSEKNIAPLAPSPCPSWSGFYFGGSVGYKWADGDTNLDLFGDWESSNIRQDIRAAIERAGSENHEDNSFEIGGLLGYNFQFNKWVFGAEAAIAGMWLDDSHAIDTGFGFPVESSFESSYLVTLGPRVGYAFCRWLPYVTGGLALSEIKFAQSFQTEGGFEQGETSDLEVGWMIGAGLQYALSEHWNIRAQYQYIDFPSIDFHSASPTIGNFLGRHELDLVEHNVSLSLIFQF